jgi:hypothetical protein
MINALSLSDEQRDAVRANPAVREFAGLLDRTETAKRAELVKQRAALPSKHAKRRMALAAACAKATEAEAAAESALREARVARASAWGALNGVEMLEAEEDNRLQEELRRSAPAFLQAACRAIEAFDLPRYAPLPMIVLARVDPWAHPAVQREQERAAASAWAEADLQSERVTAAVTALHQTRRALHDLELEALSEEDLVERVGGLFSSLNERLEHMTQSPRFVIDERLDVAVKFGHGEEAVKVKTSDIGAAKAQ